MILKFLNRLDVKNVAYTGFNGRIAIHETLYFTKEISQEIFNAGEKIDEESLRTLLKKRGCLL